MITFKEFVYDKHKMTFYSLSQKSGVAESTLRNMHLRGSAMNTNLSVIIKITKALGITVEEFVKEMEGTPGTNDTETKQTKRELKKMDPETKKRLRERAEKAAEMRNKILEMATEAEQKAICEALEKMAEEYKHKG